MYSVCLRSNENTRPYDVVIYSYERAFLFARFGGAQKRADSVLGSRFWAPPKRASGLAFGFAILREASQQRWFLSSSGVRAFGC